VPLLDQLSSDWGLLSDSRMARINSLQLLVDILEDTSVATALYVPITPTGEIPLNKWQEFRVELMRQNRFFPKARPDLDRLRELLVYLKVPPGDCLTKTYRARILEGDATYSPESMGPPPVGRATAGRANPAGIPYLYLASDQLTAISEMRPHRGDRVCVAEFDLEPHLYLIDLRDPKSSISLSPFAMSDEGEIILLRRNRDFLHELGEELSRPVVPRSAPVEYLPSQYLCEFIKHCGFDGVVYRSSVGPGVNVALFDANRARVGCVTPYQVDRVTVEIRAELSL
jgi:RES domain-containing protein